MSDETLIRQLRVLASAWGDLPVLVKAADRLASLTGEGEPVACPACCRGEVFGLSTDDGFWVEMGASAGGAHEHGMNGWLELIEHHPDGTEKRREYVATDSPLYTRPVAWPEAQLIETIERNTRRDRQALGDTE